MKIALITARADPYIHPIDVHGGTTLVLNLISSLVNKGHDVHIFTRLDEYNESNPQYKNVRALRQKEAGVGKIAMSEGLTVYRIPYVSYPETPEKWECQLKESKEFLQNVFPYLQNLKPDILHYFHLLSFVGWYSLFEEVPYLYKSTFSPLLLSVGRKFEVLPKERIDCEQKVLEQVPVISCQSNGEINTIICNYGLDKAKIVKVPLGVNTAIYYPKLNFDKVLDTKRTLLISPNSIKPQKKQIEAIRVLKYLQDHGNDVLLAFMGNIIDTNYMDQITELITEFGLRLGYLEKVPSREEMLQLEADVLFLPTQSEQVLSDFIRSGDIAIFPSTDEGFSLMNINCMSCGTPPACSLIPEYAEYMKEGVNAIAVDINKGWEGFATGIEYYLKDRSELKKLSMEASASVREFSWSNLIERQLDVYNSLIKNV